MRRVRWKWTALPGLMALLALSSACGAAKGAESNGTDIGVGHAEGTANANASPRCERPSEVVHPTYTAEGLRLELRDHGAGRMPVPIPPFEFDVFVSEELTGPAQMELTIHDPTGDTHVQRFTHMNMEERCDPHCLPTVNNPRCGPRRCRMERIRPRAIRIDHTIYQTSKPGRWTYVLHRLDTDERVSETRRLFESEDLHGQGDGQPLDEHACEMLPEQLGPFRRISCQRSVVPMGSTTNHWGIKAVYESENGCRANAFTLPLSQSMRSLFHEGPYAAGPLVEFEEGAVHEVLVDDVTARTWLAHHHVYILAMKDGVPGFDALVRALLSSFPNVGGPDRPVPTCEATGAIDTRTTAPLQSFESGGARFRTHFEGNRPAGAHMTFHDAHPLALAGLRRGEIVHSVDGIAVTDRQELFDAFERLTRPGQVEIVVSRARMRHARCVRVSMQAGYVPPPDPDEAQVAPPPPPPPVSGPRRGRHCERRSDQCWDCVEFDFPAGVGCAAGCRRDQICVTLGGRVQCLSSTRVCCAAGTACNVPPGCDGAASSCSADTAGGPNDRCTFLAGCPAPLPSAARE